MSKIAEEKALEAYPPCINSNGFDLAESRREGYIKGYDQTLQDLSKDANQYMFLSDEIGYAYACGCRKTMQGFMEKAEKFLSEKIQDYFWWNNEECFAEFDKEDCLEQFKNYMQYESEN